MKRLLLALAATVTILLVGLGFPALAQGANGDTMTRFDVAASLQDDGTLTVTQTVDVTYAGSSSHGPYFFFITRQEYSGSQDRAYEYSNITVTSPTGAPANLQTTTEDGYISLRVGSASQTVSGVQTYVLSYTIKGGLNANVEESGMDELYWNVIGTGYELPISNISVTITSGHDVKDATCYYGSDYNVACTSHSSSGTSATYTQSSLSPGQGLAVVAGWPSGTYSDSKILVDKPATTYGIHGNGLFSLIAAGVLSLLSVFGVGRLSRAGRDEQFAGVAPGTLPFKGEEPDIVRAEVKDAAVEFAPPKGVPARLVGAIAREGTAKEDVTAAIVALAVAGHLHMTQDSKKHFTLTRTNADLRGLNPTDRRLYDLLLGGAKSVSSDTISSEDFYTSYSAMETTIDTEFNAQNWYKTPPNAVVNRYRVGGLAIAIGGPLLSWFLGEFLAVVGWGGLGWLAVPCVIIGLGMTVMAKRMPVRTPIGSVVAVQAIGFRKYLETAEADQIKWEEGQDIFSEYLPYAIAFGCADRWAKIFEDLAASGAPVPQPTWYTGYGYGHGYGWGSINNSIGNIGDSFASSVQEHAQAQMQASGGSSGGSGFSGGGGGGGFGGGGGGTW
ncbi:MAG: DUF2207 domain-containing protein [Propionibacteriaceae bacterium]|jgi:uncharacterized membrane protein YgcG|nr:DUF2207 domain-containing protein [Propionibacteriaceae bacterium]